jgi:hypothetical protein
MPYSPSDTLPLAIAGSAIPLMVADAVSGQSLDVSIVLVGLGWMLRGALISRHAAIRGRESRATTRTGRTDPV